MALTSHIDAKLWLTGKFEVVDSDSSEQEHQCQRVLARHKTALEGESCSCQRSPA